MTELLQLAKLFPVSLSWVVPLLGCVWAFLLIAEKVQGLYYRTKSEGQSSKNEGLEIVESMIVGDRMLEILNEERKRQEAFFRMTGLEVRKKDREELLDIFSMVSMRCSDLKHLFTFVEKYSEGRYRVQIGLVEVFHAIFTICMCFLIIFYGSYVGIEVGAQHGFLVPWVMLATLAGIFFTIWCAKGSLFECVIVWKVSNRLEELGKLEGKAGLSNQVRMAFIRGWKGFFIALGVFAVIFGVAFLVRMI
ncbi:hypothetical protein [Chromobacterium sp. LK11]|uniref:hypothetical protein n=1 Tax=Chromobacterium sp. LK11 TaxID=1628212 RepID=UPI000A4D30CB|nr:hypothetical protein [Chromobacterium sp. LK11]